MNSNKTIRLRTTPGESQNIQFKIEQEFDTLDILSLKITQEEVYRNFCSDYGVVVGRVIANDGFGVENAKISVFIPISNEDQDNPKIFSIYPYTTVNDTDVQGVRYNLLPKQGKKYIHYQTFPSGFNPNNDQYNYQAPFKGQWIDTSWTLETTNSDGTVVYSREVELTYGPKVPTGTFPSKQEFLDNDVLLEVYEKYYKLTTKTNTSGDYMLFGVPVGNQTIHMDVDLSDAGQSTLTVDDFINAGFPQQLFDVSGNKFLASTNLDSLPQIESRNISVEVVPFWGDLDQCEIGITRLDINLNKTVTPSASLVFQSFTNIDGYIKANDCNIGDGNGDYFTSIANMEKLENTTIKYSSEDGNFIKEIVFNDGNVYITVPMYQERKITDEFGNIIDSPDNEKGIPTSGKYSFSIWGNGLQKKYDIEEKYNTGFYTIEEVVFRYDLLNKKRLIYTLGNLNTGEDCVGTCYKKWFAIRTDTFGTDKLMYPSNNTRGDGSFIFGGNAICYGSLYFPVFEVKKNNNGLDDPFWYSCCPEHYPEGSYSYGTSPSGWKYGCLSVNHIMDITDILYLFLPFGGNLPVTSCLTNQFTNPFAGLSLENGYDDGTVDLKNQTIPLKNSDLGVVNPFFPKRLNTLQTSDTLYNLNVIGESLISPEYKISRVGWYFFYFGLYENDNALTNLKQKLG